MEEKRNSGSKEKKKAIRPAINCESCVFYDYDEFYDCYLCRQNLDEDEMERFRAGQNAYCPYYKYYDEYKSVQKQN